jgi:two-component system, NarL family, invasion response regulator UvrY
VKIKILLADDHDLVRAGLRHIVEESGEVEVVAEAADGAEAIRKALMNPPDVAVVDLSMPGMDGLEVVGQLKLHYPKLPILILTMHDEEQFVVRALEAGAMGYITKRAAPDQLVKAIRKLRAGGRYLSNVAAEALAMRVGKSAPGGSLLDSLSNRELQVLRGLALGQTSREVADAYGISIKTVNTYRERLLKKLNLRNTIELVRFAIQNRLVDP